MIEGNNTTSHASETTAAAAQTRGDERVVKRIDEDDATAMNTDNPTQEALAVAAPPDATAGSPGTPSEFSPAEPYLESLVLQPDLPAGGKEQFHVAELLQYHDQHFVENVYSAILGRKPCDVERARELAELRGGRVSKVEIIERLLAAQEEEEDGASPARRVRIEGLPSPVVRRLSRVPVLGYVLRLGRALWRLPVLMQHQQGFEIYALAQQQLITDHVNRALPQLIAGQRRIVDHANQSLQQLSTEQRCIVDHTNQSLQQLIAEQTNQAVTVSALERAVESATSRSVIDLSQTRDVLEAVAMFSDALLDLSNSHANLQTQTQAQVEQIEAALTDLTQSITTQQQITEEIKREQHTLADAQQEFLTQEQRIIVETQKVVLEELRGELRELTRRQESVRAELDAKVRRLQTLSDAPRPNSSGQA